MVTSITPCFSPIAISCSNSNSNSNTGNRRYRVPKRTKSKPPPNLKLNNHKSSPEPPLLSAGDATLREDFSSSQNHAFTVNYLIQNLDFSPQTASKLSNKLHFNDSQKPNSVLSLFKSYGFSNSQLSTIFKTYPNLLSFDPNKTIIPKFNFLLSKGASNSDLVQIITKNPLILSQSLEKTITPSYDFVKSFLLSDESTIVSLKNCACLLFSKTPSQNIQILLQNGVPHSKVVILFRNWYSMLIQKPPIFEKVVLEVKELGFNPKTTFFIVALRARMMKSVWERNTNVYKKWGWSEEIIVSAFLRYPWCMLASVDKIEAMMQFFVNNMGWESLVLAKNPILLMLSLEKRVIPRAFVLKFLESKDLFKDAKLATPFKVSEDAFLKRFVTCFEEEASQLLKLYEEKKDVSNNVLKKCFVTQPCSSAAYVCDCDLEPCFEDSTDMQVASNVCVISEV